MKDRELKGRDTLSVRSAGAVRHGGWSVVERAITVCLLMAWLVGCGSPSYGPLDPVPQPDLSQFESAVQEQLLAQQGRLDQALQEKLPKEELAEVFGDLGRHYEVYELLEAAAASYRNAHRLDPQDYRWTYHLAVVEQAVGRLEEAAILFGRAAEIKPDDLPAQVRLGEVLLDSGQMDAARKALEQALKLDASCALAHYFLGLLEQGEGNSASATLHLTRVLELQPQATVVHYSLAQALRAEGRDDEARHYADLIGSEEVRLEDPLIHALDDLRTGAAAHIRRAAKAQVDGYFEAARREYERAITADPSNPEAHQGMGSMLVQQGDLDGAVRHFSQALELGAANASRVLSNLGSLEVTRGNLDIGVEHYRRALELDPGMTAIRFALAKALADAGRLDGAVEQYRDVLEQEPRNVGARLNLGLALTRQGEVDEARRMHREVLELDITNAQAAEALSHLAGLEAQEGDFGRAESLYRRAVEREPSSGGAWFGLGNLLGRQGRYQDAIESYRAALNVEPHRAQAWLGEATAHALLENWTVARARLEASLEAVPGDPSLQLTLARLLVTCPDRAVQDPSRGRQLAEQVFERARSLEAAEIIAMGLATEGRMTDAVRWQEQIVMQLEQSGQPAAAAARQQLELYRRQVNRR